MTLQLLHSEFPSILGKFDFLFYQCSLYKNMLLTCCFFLLIWDPACRYQVSSTEYTTSPILAPNPFSGIRITKFFDANSLPGILSYPLGSGFYKVSWTAYTPSPFDALT
jgi:hypothetical protein